MKIIQIISGGDVGGAKAHVLSLLRGLMQRHEVLLVCFVEGDFSREARQFGIPTQVYSGNNLLRICAALKELIRQQGFELIHCHGAKGNVMGLLLKQGIDVPVITTVHSDPKLDYMGRPLADLTYGNANRFALKRLDYWVAVSDMIREKLTERGIDGHRIFSIYNGVDFSEPLQPMPRAVFLQSLGIDWDDQQVIFGIAARISSVKDMTTLVTAFAAAVQKQPDMKLLIAGDGEQRQEIEQLAKRLCPAGSYHFAGWLQDVNSFYHALDVNLLTSRSEGVPYAILEGARSRCATIATAVGGVPKMVIDGVTGFLLQPGDVTGLSERMVQLADDGTLRSHLANAIYEKVKREFSAEATVRTQEEIYEAILRRKQRSALERDGVVISGSYGNGNAGDETILETIIQRLQSYDPDLPICVMSRKPRQTAARNGVTSVYTFAPWKVMPYMRRAKLLISGGGSLIQNVTSTRSLIFYLSVIRRAHRCGCKVMMYGCGIGPVHGKRMRQRTGKIIDANVDLVTLRDPESLEELKRLGVQKPMLRVTADPALLQTVTPEQQRKYRAYEAQAGMEQAGRYCLMALRPWSDLHNGQQIFADAAEYVYKKYGLIPALFQLEPGKDRGITRAVYEKIACPKLLLPELTDGAQIYAMMRRMELVISMRLHALIFAVSQGTPVVGISYDPKVRGFMNYTGQKGCISTADLTSAALCHLIDETMAAKDQQERVLEDLRARARENDALAWKLLQDEPISLS